jgi:hypothetical protein
MRGPRSTVRTAACRTTPGPCCGRTPSARSSELPVGEAAGRPRAPATVAVVALEGAEQHAELVSGQVRRTVRIRDGRILTEALRERRGEGEEFTVLDRAGRLPLPRDYVERYWLRGRVLLTGEAGHVGVWLDRDDRTGS